MGLEAEVDAAPGAVQRITAVARRTSTPAFCDLLWPPCPHPAALMTDPGVMFESPRRIVVFQRIGGELRYYAGGWCPDKSRIYLEQDRVWAEGIELGVLGSVADALTLAKQYLAEERTFAALSVRRAVRYSRYPQGAAAEPGPPAVGGGT
jgi:hypothetical protein